MAEETTRYFMSTWDWLVVVAYIAVVLWLGLRFAKRQTTTDHYFIAERRIPGWAMGVSMFATMLSSFTYIASPGWSYEHDWQVLVREGMCPLVVLFCAILIIPIYRRAIRMSAYEYLEHRFGYVGRLYGTAGFLFGHFLKVGIVLYALAVALGSITGWPLAAVIVVLGGLTICFTFFGGIEGVVWTDVLQGFIMLGGGLIVIFYLMFVATPGHPGELLPIAYNGGHFKLLDFEFDMHKQTFWVFAWIGLFQFLTKYGTDQTMVQRYLLAPTVKDAVKGTFLGLGCCAIAWVMFYGIGSLLWGFYQVYPERLGAHITKGDEVFPYFIGRELPRGITGIVLAGLFSSALSTISSDLNSIGACVTSDFYDRFVRRPTERARLLLGKMTVLISGIAVVVLAYLLSFYKGGILQFTLVTSAYVGAIVGGGLLGMFLLGFFTRRSNRQGIYVALVAGLLFTIWALLSKIESLPFPIRYTWNDLWLPGFSNVLVMIVGYVSSFFVRGRTLAPLHLTIYGYKLREEEPAPSVGVSLAKENAE